jgi:hypothetical protein
MAVPSESETGDEEGYCSRKRSRRLVLRLAKTRSAQLCDEPAHGAGRWQRRHADVGSSLCRSPRRRAMCRMTDQFAARTANAAREATGHQQSAQAMPRSSTHKALNLGDLVRLGADSACQRGFRARRRARFRSVWAPNWAPGDTNQA